jgi:hypothetical protein
MNTIPRLLQVVDGLMPSAWRDEWRADAAGGSATAATEFGRGTARSAIRRLTQTPLHRRHKFILAQSRLAAR